MFNKQACVYNLIVLWHYVSTDKYYGNKASAVVKCLSKSLLLLLLFSFYDF